MWGEVGSCEEDKRWLKGKWVVHSKDVTCLGAVPNAFIFLFWCLLPLPSQSPCHMVDEAVSSHHEEVGVTVRKADIKVWAGVRTRLASDFFRLLGSESSGSCGSSRVMLH